MEVGDKVIGEVDRHRVFLPDPPHATRASSTLTVRHAGPYDADVTRSTSTSRWSSFLLVLLVGVSVASSAEAQRRRRERTPPTTTQQEPRNAAHLVFSGLPDGAEILIDEQQVGVAPVGPLVVAPGEHALRVRLEGFSEYTDVITVVAGRDLQVPVDLIPISHVLVVESEPVGARVYVDNNYSGDTPTELELRDGTHSLRLVMVGYEELTQSFEASAGHRDVLRLTLSLLPPPSPPQWYEDPIIWIVTGAVALAAVGITVGVVVATSQPSQRDSFCAPPNQCLNFDPGF